MPILEELHYCQNLRQRICFSIHAWQQYVLLHSGRSTLVPKEELCLNLCMEKKLQPPRSHGIWESLPLGQTTPSSLLNTFIDLSKEINTLVYLFPCNNQIKSTKQTRTSSTPTATLLKCDLKGKRKGRLPLKPHPLKPPYGLYKEETSKPTWKTPWKFNKRRLEDPIHVCELFPTLFQPIIIQVTKRSPRIMQLIGGLISPAIRDDHELSPNPLLKIDIKDIVEIRAIILHREQACWQPKRTNPLRLSCHYKKFRN